MANSYLNIVTFLMTTVFYYLAIKPNLTYDISVDPAKYKEYVSKNYMFLAVYLLLVIVVQFMVNASIITSTCGGSITENIGAAGVFTFLPWTLIFGVLVLILTIYPGFKSAFSDVIGYYWVSTSANKIINELLVDPNIQKKIDTEESATPQQKEALQSAADAIIKICGNTSILINQIVPSNFNSYWGILTPLMKQKYQTDSPETSDIKNKLYELVVTSVTNPKTMEQNYQKFLDAEQQAQQQKDLATSTTYTITN
jgi:hypothetical protein